MLIESELDIVGKYLIAPKDWKDEYEIIVFLAKNKTLQNEIFEEGDVEVNKRKRAVLKKLIHENIVRKTSTKKQGKICEFHSPKFALAVKNFKIKRIDV